MACSVPFWKLTEEQSARLAGCSSVAIRLWLTVLWAHPAARMGEWRCSGEAVRSAYLKRTGRKLGRRHLTDALGELEHAGLLRSTWEDKPKLRVLVSLGIPTQGVGDMTTSEPVRNGNGLGCQSVPSGHGIRSQRARNPFPTGTDVPQEELIKNKEEGGSAPAPPARTYPDGVRTEGAPPSARRGIPPHAKALLAEAGVWTEEDWRRAEEDALWAEADRWPLWKRRALRKLVRANPGAMDRAIEAMKAPPREASRLWGELLGHASDYHPDDYSEDGIAGEPEQQEMFDE